MEKVIVVHGPNLNLLGEREPDVYGSMTLADINAGISEFAGRLGFRVECFQSNHEGIIIDFLHDHRRNADALVINPGAFTHYSYALRDAIAAIALPAVEVHLSDIEKREAFRHVSVVKDVCIKQIKGLGYRGYLRAVEFLAGTFLQRDLKSELSMVGDKDQALKLSVRSLHERFPWFDWTGIYLVEAGRLSLHNYIGKPTQHTSIELHLGICGACVNERKTLIIEDVNRDPRYIACSIETKTEIVTPIMSGQEVVGVIDVDSDSQDVFNETTAEILESIAVILRPFL
jgi:3-dehydroquinate dehydratase-2